MNRKIYEKLKTVAKTDNIITYSEIAPLANLNMSKQSDRAKIGKILGEISRFEHENNRPMLSVLVIHKENNIPGRGFFKLAMELGIYKGEDDFMFFTKELRKVYDYWQSQ